LALCERARSARGVQTDVKYILCEACEHVAEAVVDALGAIEPPVTEVAVLDAMEALCNPREKVGRWMRSIDLKERGRKLKMEAQKGVQECSKECATISMACEEVVEAVGTTELAENAFKFYKEAKAAGMPVNERKVKAWLCVKGGPGGACDRPTPKLPADRPKGPEFSAKGDKDLQVEDMLANMNHPGMKMYNKDELQDMYPDDDDDTDESAFADGAAVDQEENGDASHSSASPVTRVPQDRLADLRQFVESGVKKLSNLAQSARGTGLEAMKRLGIRSDVDEL
jgi:hypothetical protein